MKELTFLTLNNPTGLSGQMTHDVATFDIIHPKKSKKINNADFCWDPFVLFGFLLSIALIRFVIECYKGFSLKEFISNNILLQVHRETLTPVLMSCLR